MENRSENSSGELFNNIANFELRDMYFDKRKKCMAVKPGRIVLSNDPDFYHIMAIQGELSARAYLFPENDVLIDVEMGLAKEVAASKERRKLL